ncbi:MAG: FecR family protein [Methylophilus sp.]|uniref:FecR family protein n=1 Tax=Methylophilus sp. TaxID=29541 RepID=UPI003F9F16BD
MSKPANQAASPQASAVRKDVFSPYEDELRALFPSSDAILQEAKQLSHKRKKAKSRSIGTAVLLLAIATLVIDPAWQVETLSTSIGKQASHVLPDGSSVVLNTNSVLRVEQHIRTRQLQLVQGEAAFAVSHGWRPFSVLARDVRVKDIGTRFNVRLKADSVRVAVLEGTVEVNAGAQYQILTTGQAIESQLGTLSHVHPINLDHEAAWQQGKLVFNGAPLRQVVNEIQRYSAMTIQVDQAAAGIRVSGVYDTGAVETLIQDLVQSLPVEIAHTADGEVLIRKVHKQPS